MTTAKSNDFAKLQPSSEQEAIIKDLMAGKNVLTQAVAGAGKTSVALFLARATNGRILHLTYNKELKEDNAKKVKDSGFSSNIHTYTIHGLANYISGLNKLSIIVKDEESLLQFLNKHWTINNFDYDYLIIDEIQDANEKMMVFFKRLYDAFNKKPTLLILGDKLQMLYAINGASSSYLNNFDVFFNLPFTRRSLLTSFRVPKKICNTLNNYFLKQDVLQGYKDDGCIKLVTLAKYKNESNTSFLARSRNESIKIIVNYIYTKITNEQAKPEDFFILGFSIKSHYFQQLEHLLTKAGWPVYYPNSKVTSSKNESDGKIAFSTINSAKGRERKYVILPQFDVANYKPWLLANAKERLMFPNTMPNLHYVGLTRATKENLLFCYNIVLNSNNGIFANTNDLLPYVDYKNILLDKGIDFVYPQNLISIKNLFKNKSLQTTNTTTNLKNTSGKISDVIAFIAENEIKELVNGLKIAGAFFGISNYSLKINHHLFAKNKQYHSHVTLINGLFLFLQYLVTHSPHIFATNFKFYIKKATMLALNEKDPASYYFKQQLKADEEARKQISANSKQNLTEASPNQDLDLYHLAPTILLNPVAFWKQASNENKLKLCAVFSACMLGTNNITQLPAFNWLDGFKTNTGLNDLLAHCKINNASFQTQWNYSLTPLSNFSNKKVLLETITLKILGYELKLTRNLQENEINTTITPNSVLLNSNISLQTDIDIISQDTIFNFDYNQNNEQLDGLFLLKTALDAFVVSRFLTILKETNYKIKELDANIDLITSNQIALNKLALILERKQGNLSYENALNIIAFRKKLKDSWDTFLNINPLFTNDITHFGVLNFFTGNSFIVSLNKVQLFAILEKIIKIKATQTNDDKPLSYTLDLFVQLKNDIENNLQKTKRPALENLQIIDKDGQQDDNNVFEDDEW